jgi:hypothetical protein
VKPFQIILSIKGLIIFSSCGLITLVAVGIKQYLSKFSDKSYLPSIEYSNLFDLKIIKSNINLRETLLPFSVPSKEELSMIAQILIHYRTR